MGSLFDGGTQTSETKNEIPSWLESGSKKAVGIAKGIADRPYEAYTGDRVAGATNNEQAGYLAAGNYAGSYQPYLAQAAGALGNADQNFTDADIQAYMNPYTTAVTNIAARKMGDTFEQQRNQRNAGAVASGAYGGLRSELGNQGAEDNYLENIGDLYTQNLGNAFNQASGLWSADRANQSSLGQLYGSLASTSGGLAGNNISNKINAGQSERGINQAQADANYNDYLTERDWQLSNLQPLVSTLGSVPHGSTSTNTQQTQLGLGNYVSQGIGAGAAAFGAFGGGGAAASGGGGGGGGSYMSPFLNSGFGGGYGDGLSY